MFLDTLTSSLPIVVLVAQIIFVVVVVDYCARKDNSLWAKYVHRREMKWGLFISLVATLGSLFYSDVLGYEPCVLCWYQRILLYPQVLIYAVAIRRGSKDAWVYTGPLNVIGIFVAGYHSVLQSSVGSGLPCPATGGVSCGIRFVMEFGYMTIPLMGLTTFVVLLLLGFWAKKAA